MRWRSWRTASWALRLQATLRSNKEGCQIPEEKVLRCFGKVSLEQIQQYKTAYLLRDTRPRVRKLTRTAPEPLPEEMDLFYNWRIHQAGLSPEQKISPETRAYPETEAAKRIIQRRHLFFPGTEVLWRTPTHLPQPDRMIRAG